MIWHDEKPGRIQVWLSSKHSLLCASVASLDSLCRWLAKAMATVVAGCLAQAVAVVGAVGAG